MLMLKIKLKEDVKLVKVHTPLKSPSTMTALGPVVRSLTTGIESWVHYYINNEEAGCEEKTEFC